MSKRLLALVTFLAVVGIGFWAALLVGLYYLVDRPRDEPLARPRQDPEEWRQEVAQAFKQPAKVEGDLTRELRAFFDSVGAAARRGDDATIRTCFDIDRMAEEICRAAGVPVLDQADFARGFRSRAGAGLGRQLDVLTFARYDIKAVKRLPAAEEVAVIIRHRDQNGESVRVRWWLRHGPAGWRIFDLEGLDFNLRISTFAGAGLAPALGGKLPKWLGPLRFIGEARQALAAGKLDQAEALLGKAAHVRFPDDMEGCRWLILGTIQLQRGNARAALDHLTKAASFNADMPMVDLLRGTAYNTLGQHAKALDHVRRFSAVFGDDNEALHQTGLALVGLGRRAEALESFRKGLADEPNSPGTVSEIRKVLPAGQKAELGDHFARLADPAGQLFVLADAAWKENDLESVEVLAKAMRKVKKDDPEAAFFLARIQGRKRKLDEALALYKSALVHQHDAKVREEYVSELLRDADAAGQPLRGYEAAPDADFAFRFLARSLRWRDRDGLDRLLAAHRRKRPADPALAFITAQQHFDDGELEQAERALAAVEAGRLDEATRKDYWSTRVLVRFRMGKGLSAYTDLGGPKLDIFVQLCRLFADAKDAKQLGALVSARRRDTPDDVVVDIWQGELRWLENNHAAVVALLRERREAILANKGDRSWYYERLVPSLFQIGRAAEARREIKTLVTEGAGAADIVQALVHAAIGARNADMLEAIAVAQRQQAPAKPDGPLHLARVKLWHNQVDEAVRLFKTGLALEAEVAKRDRHVDDFLFAMLDAGRVLDGYRAAPVAAKALEILCEELLERRRFDKQQRHHDDLQRLLDAHRKAHPNDATLAFYQSELYVEDKQYQKAEDVCARAMAGKPDAAMQDRLRHQRVFARFKLGKGLSTYAEFGRSKAVFDQLALLCEVDKDSRQLDALVAAHRRAEPADPSLPMWQMEVKWLAGDYGAAVALLRQHRQGVFAQPLHRWKVHDRLVRALVRLKQPGEALKEADAAQAGGGAPLLLALAHAAAGDVAKTQAALATCVRRHVPVASFYSDPDLGPLLRSDKLRTVRERFPEPKAPAPPAA
jgi:hypothetical protein